MSDLSARGGLPAMPGPPQKRLTPAQAKTLDAASTAIRKAERRWCELAREYGYSAVARHTGLTPEAVRKRVQKILGP